MTSGKDYGQLLADPSVRLLNIGLAQGRRYTTGEHISPWKTARKCWSW
ncbi:hypothetical protein [Actinomadura harenae]|nr:hypothetical protein [Actinomadura harenae]